MLKSGLLLSLLMTASIATGSSDNISIINGMLDQARPQSVKIVNTLSRPVDREATLTRLEMLKAGEKKRIKGAGFVSPVDGKSMPSVWVRNYATSARSVSFLEKILLRVNPGDSLEVSVDQWPSFVSGLQPSRTRGIFLDNTTQDGDFSVNIVASEPDLSVRYPRAFVGDSKDLSYQQKLYKKYFLPGQDVNGEDIWQDFANQPSGVTATKRPEEVIISMTSYPARFETTWLAIESLLRQQEKPDRIVLNLFEDEFPGHVLPWFIQQQMRRGLEINWNAENLKVYLKVIPTMQKYPEAAVVALDDDVIYPKDRLKNLMDGYRQHPDCVIASDVRVVGTTGSFILPVNSWHFTGWYPSSEGFSIPRHDIVPEGVFGILIPPHTFYKDFLRKDLFFSLCPNDDDLWTYAMIVMSGKKVVKVERKKQPIINVEGSQEVESSLWRSNFANRSEKLSQYFSNIYRHYNLQTLFGNKECGTSMLDIKRGLSRGSFQYNSLLPFNEIDKRLDFPADLVSSFGAPEPEGIWTLGAKSQFRVYRPSLKSPIIRIILEGKSFIHPTRHFSRFRFNSENNPTDIQELKYTDSEKKTLSFMAQMEKPEQVFEIHTPDFVMPLSFGLSSDFRELSLYVSRFGVFEISPSVGTIPLGKSFSLSSPINLEDGFHEMEDEGVWGTNKSTFTIAFPEKAKEYKIDIDYHAFAPSENPRLGFRLMNGDVEIFKGVAEHGKDQSPFSFTYTPDRLVTKLTLEADQAKSPLELGISEDTRLLGLFLKSINITKI